MRWYCDFLRAGLSYLLFGLVASFPEKSPVCLSVSGCKTSTGLRLAISGVGCTVAVVSLGTEKMPLNGSLIAVSDPVVGCTVGLSAVAVSSLCRYVLVAAGPNLTVVDFNNFMPTIKPVSYPQHVGNWTHTSISRIADAMFLPPAMGMGHPVEGFFVSGSRGDRGVVTLLGLWPHGQPRLEFITAIDVIGAARDTHWSSQRQQLLVSSVDHVSEYKLTWSSPPLRVTSTQLYSTVVKGENDGLGVDENEAQKGDVRFAYIAAGGSGLRMLSLVDANPAHLLYEIPLQGWAGDVIAHSHYVFVAADPGLFVFSRDPSASTAPKPCTQCTMLSGSGWNLGMMRDGNGYSGDRARMIFVADNEGGFQIVEFDSSLNPVHQCNAFNPAQAQLSVSFGLPRTGRCVANPAPSAAPTAPPTLVHTKKKLSKQQAAIVSGGVGGGLVLTLALLGVARMGRRPLAGRSKGGGGELSEPLSGASKLHSESADSLADEEGTASGMSNSESLSASGSGSLTASGSSTEVVV
jgi:hypothetical protein